MKKFLVLYMMSAEGMAEMMTSSTPEQRQEGMDKWKVWMGDHQADFADDGGPVGKTKQINVEGVSDIKNSVGGYSIVQADSHEAATAIFSDSPHLAMPGATVEVMEIMSM